MNFNFKVPKSDKQNEKQIHVYKFTEVSLTESHPLQCEFLLTDLEPLRGSKQRGELGLSRKSTCETGV